MSIASTSNCLKIHQWSNGTLKNYYIPNNNDKNDPIKSISWSRDGTWLLLVPSTGPAEIISAKDNLKLLNKIEEIYHPTCAVFQNNTKRNIAIGTISGKLSIYDIKSRNITKWFPNAPSTIFDIKWNASDSHIAAACINGNIIIYNTVSSNFSSSYKIPNCKTVSAINFHNCKRNLLTAGSEEGIVAVWDINTNNVLCHLKAHQATVTDLMFSPIRSDLVISSGLDRRLEFYDILSKKCVIEFETTACTTALDLSSCGMYLSVGSQTGNIITYDTRNFKKPLSAFIGHEQKKIFNLFFQKSLSGNSSENVSITFPEEDLEPSQECRNSVDSVDLKWFKNKSNKVVDYSLKAQDHDSFLAALGLESSLNISELSVKNDDVRNITFEDYQPIADVEKKITLQNTFTTLKSSIKQVSSTPKHIIDKLPSITESPIIEDSVTAGSLLVELKQAVKDVVTSELKTKVEELKTSLKYEIMEATHDLRTQILSLQMANVKQSMYFENKLNSMNMSLKQKNNFS